MEELNEIFLNLNLIGRSDAFVNTLQVVKTVSMYDAGVYILGETGTGKELIARAIHYLSVRKNAPFIAINCGALTDDLLYNELFGHTKGSFSGAVSSSIGLIEAADGGTLFLDEVDSLSPKFQVTLLRFLQEREYKPIGSVEFKKADVRVICATNRDLNDCVKSGDFRKDLLFRIDLLRVEIPPLSKRHGDIPLLTKYFINKLSGKYNFSPQPFSKSVIQWMESYDWPGNVRELENFVLKQSLLGENTDADVLLYKDGTFETSDNKEDTVMFCSSFNEEKERAIRNFEFRYLQSVLVKTNGNISQAAQLAGKERSCFSKLMKKYRLYNIKKNI
jgi:transcriptional regulator with GAF, ATPase, and Fis domain